MTAAIPGAVFDCNTLLQAVISDTGPAFACVSLVDSGKVVLYVSSATTAEAADVLNRPKLQKKFQTLTPERVREFLERINAKAVHIDPVPAVFTLVRDPKDERYVNLAAAAGARYLVTRDKDLLDLMADPEFRGRFPDLAIVDPVAFLQAIAPQESEPTDTPHE